MTQSTTTAIGPEATAFQNYNEWAGSELERRRAFAYADPINGSDRLFTQAARMQAMGIAGWEDVRDQGIARYAEIKASISL